MQNPLTSRRYPEVAAELRAWLANGGFTIGDKLPAERHLAEKLSVSRSLLREALIMLEIQGFVEVRQGSGIYIHRLPNEETPPTKDDIGPFELLQARQVIESCVAEAAAYTVTKNDIDRLQQLLQQEKDSLKEKVPDYRHDEEFHLGIAQATQNSALFESVHQLWQMRKRSSMWEQLHRRFADSSYRSKWLGDHQKILDALRRKDAGAARQAMWQHLENVRETLFTLSDVDAPEFDGYLFQSMPITQQKLLTRSKP